MSTDDEVVEYAKRLRAAAVERRMSYPEAYVPEPEWDMLDQFNRDMWVDTARKLMKAEQAGEETR